MPRGHPKVTTRDEFFRREREAWKAFTQSWEGLSDELLRKPGACGELWSIKDVVNHTAVWQELAIEKIPALLAGERVRVGAGTDRFNALHYEQDRDKPWDESLARMEKSHRKLLKLLAGVSDEQLLSVDSRQAIGWWAKWNTYAHYESHTRGLLAFRERVTGLV
jgi:hypothetical protein